MKNSSSRLNGCDFFRVALILIYSALCTPIWIGILPPLTDFPGHLATADIWINLNHNSLYRTTLARNSLFGPNRLSTVVPLLLHPAVSIVNSLRILVSLSVLALLLSTVWTLKTLGRDKWLVFLVAPFVWGASLCWGFVNFLPCLATVVFFAGFGPRVANLATLSRKWWFIGLVVSLTTLWANGLGFVMSCFVFTLSVVVFNGARKVLFYGSSLLPSSILFVCWYALNRAGSRLPFSEGYASAEAFTHKLLPLQRISAYAFDAIDVTTSGFDTRLFLILLACIIYLLASQQVQYQPHGTMPGRRVLSLLRTELCCQWSLLLSFLFLGLAFYIPEAWLGVVLSPRFVTPGFIFLAMSPQNIGSRLYPIILSLVTILTIVFCMHVSRSAYAWNEIEIAPLQRIISKVPRKSRAACVGTRWRREHFRRSPLTWACDALLHAERGALASGGFAEDGFNSIRFKFQSRTRLPGRLADQDWLRQRSSLLKYEYIIVRELSSTKKLHRKLQLIAQESSIGQVKRVTYSLYRQRTS